MRQADTVMTGADQAVVMNSERFAIPEVLFRPDIVGQFFEIDAWL